MSHFSVNAVRPITSYIMGVLALCVFGWAISQNVVPLPYVLATPHHKMIAIGLFGIAALCGVFALVKNSQRSEKPWAVSRAQVNRYFWLFISFSFAAVLAAK
jgi:hypothetical protein